jgi:hypothetical protein
MVGIIFLLNYKMFFLNRSISNEQGVPVFSKAITKYLNRAYLI